MVLSREQLTPERRVNASSYGTTYTRETGIVYGFPDPYGEHYQPNGIDLSLAEVEHFYQGSGPGVLSVDSKHLPRTWKVPLTDYGKWDLKPGSYLVRFNETVDLPNDVMAYLLPRSSLLRSGVTLETAVWDAGYTGAGQALLVVHHPAGWVVEKNARIGQMVFHRLEVRAAEGYAGSYQGEGIVRSVAMPDDAVLMLSGNQIAAITNIGLRDDQNDDERIDNMIRRNRERLDP